MDAALHAPPADRVRANTWPPVNERLDAAVQVRLRRLSAASPDELRDAVESLDREWDFERVLEAEAALMGVGGLALGSMVDRRFLVLPGFVAAMLLVHALHGWYPLLPVFRRLGVRTADEIDRERYAWKGLRGDFARIPPPGTAATERAAAAWRAVCA